MKNHPTLRLFEINDRSALRGIACDTADNGSPCESFFHDRELLADLLTGYYTDVDPRFTWVAIDGGEVVGYLTGCLDSRKCSKMLGWRIVPGAILRALIRGVLFHQDTWRLIWTGVRIWVKTGNYQKNYIDACPAHFHINLRPRSRGQGVGRGLLTAFLHQVAEASVPGVHLATRADNPTGCRFFERMGFVLAEKFPSVFPSSVGSRIGELCVYVNKMETLV